MFGLNLFRSFKVSFWSIQFYKEIHDKYFSVGTFLVFGK